MRAMHARTLLPAALASVSFGFVLVRVRVRWDHGVDEIHLQSPPKDSLIETSFLVLDIKNRHIFSILCYVVFVSFAVYCIV